MESLFKKSRTEFIEAMQDIEMEMLEEYENEYGENGKSLYSARALRLLAEVFVFVKKMIPYYRSTSKMMDHLYFAGETGECRYLTAFTGDVGISPFVFSVLDEVERRKTVVYASRWLEYYYRVYEKAKQEKEKQEKVEEQLARILELGQKKSADEKMRVLEEEKETEEKTAKKSVSRKGRSRNGAAFPVRLYQHLDSYVVGQDDAKKAIAMAVHRYINHKRRTNVLMIGPSGSGKNYIMDILSQFPDLEKEMVVYVHDSSSLTPNGFQGGNIQDIFKEFSSLCRAKGKSVKRGIIYMDEIDKIIYPNTDSHDENVNATVQRQLLAAIEGTTTIAGVNTGDILFVLGGAFESLYELEAAREKKKQSRVGFFAVDEKENSIPMEECRLKEDLLKLGAQKEFIARIPVVVRMNRLNKEELKQILLHEKTGVISQKQEEFFADGLELEVEEDVYEILAGKMYEENLGARSARNIMEEVLGNYGFDMLFYGYRKMIVHEGVILRGEKPYFERGGENGTKRVRNVGSLYSGMGRSVV